MARGWLRTPGITVDTFRVYDILYGRRSHVVSVSLLSGYGSELPKNRVSTPDTGASVPSPWLIQSPLERVPGGCKTRVQPIEGGADKFLAYKQVKKEVVIRRGQMRWVAKETPCIFTDLSYMTTFIPIECWKHSLVILTTQWLYKKVKTEVAVRRGQIRWVCRVFQNFWVKICQFLVRNSCLERSSKHYLEETRFLSKAKDLSTPLRITQNTAVCQNVTSAKLTDWFFFVMEVWCVLWEINRS
jgi:hypothetical protein